MSGAPQGRGTLFRRTTDPTGGWTKIGCGIFRNEWFPELFGDGERARIKGRHFRVRPKVSIPRHRLRDITLNVNHVFTRPRLCGPVPQPPESSSSGVLLCRLFTTSLVGGYSGEPEVRVVGQTLETTTGPWVEGCRSPLLANVTRGEGRGVSTKNWGKLSLGSPLSVERRLLIYFW